MSALDTFTVLHRCDPEDADTSVTQSCSDFAAIDIDVGGHTEDSACAMRVPPNPRSQTFRWGYLETLGNESIPLANNVLISASIRLRVATCDRGFRVDAVFFVNLADSISNAGADFFVSGIRYKRAFHHLKSPQGIRHIDNDITNTSI